MTARAFALLVLVASLAPNVVLAQVVSGSVDATITLQASCEVNGAPGATGVDFGALDFGTHSTLFDQADAEISDTAAGISVQCTPGTQYTLAFDGGLHAASANAALGLRAMEHSGGGTFVTYNLYAASGRTVPMSINGTMGPLTADGSAQTVNVYGRALGESGLVAGTYDDTIGVTLSF
jgi:spore coat protein U-like protein